MSQSKANPIPLPCAVLALSVAVCLGSAGASEAASLRGQLRAEADQRHTFEHLLAVLQQAAKDLNDRLDSQAVAAQRATLRPARVLVPTVPAPAERSTPATSHLREALLNLPPPAR